jgi:hypothetical protein
MSKRPRGANANEWFLFLSEYPNNRSFMAVQIAEAIEAKRERCARLHERVNPASDEERLCNAPGAGAMGAVIEYRDLIRAQR